MQSILIAVGAFVGYVVAYKTYGRYLARRIFALDPDRPTAAVECEDGTDYVPTKAEILFGHHYTSIAGTGPIVGPAIGIIWGWVPALLWVVFGAIFMGAVHDFGAVVVSMRNKGRSIGDLAADYISPRARVMFLGIVFLALTIVIAIFCLVIAKVFDWYPESVFAIWCEVPIAIALGYFLYRRKGPTLPFSLAALVLMYVTVYIGSNMPLAMPAMGRIGPVVTWSVILLVYAYVASVLPVWRLLQPRDYMNGLELGVAMVLLALGTIAAHPKIVAPVAVWEPAEGWPLFPLLFIMIACGAISGFHSLVASGTTSKQIRRETDAHVVGYGSMLAEGMLAVFVIVAVAGGFGLGKETLVQKENDSGALVWAYAFKEPRLVSEGASTKEVAGKALWDFHYSNPEHAKALDMKLKAFIDGSAHMLEAMGISWKLAIAIMGVFVTSFAATTLDTATRLQRYVVGEVGRAAKVKLLENRHVATVVAVVAAGALALHDGKGAGGMALWPLFGATNQLLACLALLVVTTYLKKKGKPVYFTLVPAAIMFAITGWAMVCKTGEFYAEGLPKLHLLIISLVVIALEICMVVETVMVLARKAGPGDGGQGDKAAKTA
jgi:carbon starvation protein